MLSKGFTLLELMIVVAIISILTISAIPFYQDYVTRVYVMQSIVDTMKFKKNYDEIILDLDYMNGKFVGVRGIFPNSMPIWYPNYNEFLEYVADYNSGGFGDKNTQGVYILSYMLIFNQKLFSTKYSAIRIAYYPVGAKYYDEDGSLQTIEGAPMLFCGQDVSSGFPPVPRKYLPVSCRDFGLGADGTKSFIPHKNGAV